MLTLRESNRRPLWWHACQRYRWGAEVVMILPVVRRITGPDFRLPPFCELIAGGPAVGSRFAMARVYRWRDDVDQAKATDGVHALTALMFRGHTDRITLPLAVLRRKLGLPVEGERELVA